MEAKGPEWVGLSAREEGRRDGGCRESSGPGQSADLCVHMKSSLCSQRAPGKRWAEQTQSSCGAGITLVPPARAEDLVHSESVGPSGGPRRNGAESAPR